MPSYHSDLESPLEYYQRAKPVRRRMGPSSRNAVSEGCGSSCPYLPTLSANVLVVMASHQLGKHPSRFHGKGEWGVEIPMNRGQDITVLRYDRTGYLPKGLVVIPLDGITNYPVPRQHLQSGVPPREGTPRTLSLRVHPPQILQQ